MELEVSVIYEKIEKLVNENKLSIAGNHKTNQKHYLEKNKDIFLERVKRSVMWRGNSNRKFPVLEDDYCFECGRYLDYFLEGETLVANHESCFDACEIMFEIPVPTGELLLADWLEHGKDIIGHLDEEYHDINSLKGRVDRSFHYAKEGIVHVFVGNSCPTIFQKDNTLFIANMFYGDNDEEIPPVENVKDIGSICTDLWWTTAVDRSIYEKIAIEKFGDETGKRMADEATKSAHVVVNVEPGTYLVRYFTKSRKNNSIYATFEKKE